LGSVRGADHAGKLRHAGLKQAKLSLHGHKRQRPWIGQHKVTPLQAGTIDEQITFMIGASPDSLKTAENSFRQSSPFVPEALSISERHPFEDLRVVLREMLLDREQIARVNP
jgi:hypothetical protein